MADAQSPPKRPLSPGHIDQIYGTIRTGLRCLMWFGIVWCGKGAIESIAGRTTSLAVSFVLIILTEWKVSIAVSLAGCAGLWALLERRIRQRAVERLHGRIKDLEAAVDPKRSSSNLTRRGTTHPLDREP